MAAPADQRPLLTTLGYRQEWYQAQCEEFRSFSTTSAAQVRNARRHLDIPLYVIDGSHLPEQRLRGMSKGDADSISAVWHRLHRELAASSSNDHLIVAEHSSHYVQFDQPELVVQSVLEAIAGARRAGS